MKIERVIFTRPAHCKFIFRQDGGLTSAKEWPKNRKGYKGDVRESFPELMQIIAISIRCFRLFSEKQEFVPFGVLRRINFPGNLRPLFHG